MRQTLLFGGLENIAFNINRQSSDVRFYEFGRCYTYNDIESKTDALEAYSENNRLGVWLSGNYSKLSWIEKQRKSTIFDLKAYVENVFRKTLGSVNFKIQDIQNDIFSNALQYSLPDKRIIATLGVLNPTMLKRFEIKNEVFFADIDFDLLVDSTAKKAIRFSEIPKSPEVSRDLALLVDKNIKFLDIEQVAKEAERKLLKSVSLFDVYEGEKIDSDKKSYAVNFILQDNEKTLTDKQIDAVMAKLQKAFLQKLGAEIR